MSATTLSGSPTDRRPACRAGRWCAGLPHRSLDALRRLADLRGLAALLASVATGGVLTLGPGPVRADEVLAAQVDEPRAYGWRVGDVVRRVVHLQLPEGWQLDERSLPRPDQRGGELELRALRLVVDDGSSARLGDSGAAPTGLVVGGASAGAGAESDEIGTSEHRGRPVAAPELSVGTWPDVLAQGWGGSAAAWWRGVRSALERVGPMVDGGVPSPAVRQAPRQRLELDYQLFAATGTARRLELPTLTLIAEPPAGQAGATPRELRLPARPLWMVSLAGGAPGHQSGLGEMRPDVAVQGVPTAAPARQLVGSLLAGAALLVLGASAGALLRRLGVSARTQPFALASREINRLLGPGVVATLRRHGVVAPGGKAVRPHRTRVGAAAAHGAMDPALAFDGHEAAWRALHRAFDQAAGRTVLPRQARGWALADARFAPLADEIERFFDASADRFFAIGVAPAWSGGVGGGAGAAERPRSRRTPPADGAANDANGFDEARLWLLAKALARAEAAGLATRGAVQAVAWARRGRLGRGVGAVTLVSGAGGNATRTGEVAPAPHSARPGRP
ncbi:MAG: hypothetical protein RL375_1273 [Pseudomonadota bacterium]